MLACFLALTSAVAEKSDCGHECHLLRSRLDPARDCRREIRSAAVRSQGHSAGNACLSAFMAAFRDECPRACASKLEGLEPTESIPISAEDCPNDELAACRAGHAAGLSQTRHLLRISQAGPVANETGVELADEPLQPRFEEPTVGVETIAIRYRGQDALVPRREGQPIHEAAATWCRAHDDTPVCPRLLLMLLEDGYL